MDGQIVSAIIAIIGLLIQLVILIVGSVWVVGKLQANASNLKTTIDHLSSSVERLQSWLSRVDGQMANFSLGVSERLAKLETRLSNHLDSPDRRSDCNPPPPKK